MDNAVLHHYRHFRRHQLATWHKDSNSGGGAWPGEHAAAALRSARMHLNFMKRMERYTAPAKRRRNRQ